MRISGQAQFCLNEAEACERAAAETKDLVGRKEWQRIAARWSRLAESYQLAERISGFIEWNSQRLPSPD